MRKNVVKNEYFDWLLDTIDCEDNPVMDYSRLLEYLFGRKYYWLMVNDRNRALDGLDLRSQFAFEHGYDLDVLDGIIFDECTMLEMLVALAARTEREIMGDPRDPEDHTFEWFWTMIENLNLDRYDDDHYDDVSVRHIVDIFLEKYYTPDGKGGLFPIPGVRKDLRNMEIWHQLCLYLDKIIDEEKETDM